MKQNNNMQKGKGRGLLRSLILMAAVLGTAVPARAQTTTYVIMNGNTFVAHTENGQNIASPSATTTFNPSTCFWYVNNRRIQTANRNGARWSDNNYYLRAGTTGDATVNNTNTQWNTATAGQVLISHTTSWIITTTYYRLYLDGTTWKIGNTNSNTGTLYSVTINTLGVQNPTLSIISNPGLTNGGIQLTSSISDTYIPACTTATVNGTPYYWIGDGAASTTRPGQITDWDDATVTWEVTTGNTYASVSSNGVVTLTGNPTGDIVVQMNVSKGGYSGNTTITLSRGSGSEDVSSATVITGPTISPNSVALHYNEGSQVFTSTATAANTTTTVPAHIKLTGGGNTYYYYDGNLYSSTDDFSTTTSTPVDVTLAWSLSGDAASYLTSTPATGTSTTVTHTTQSPSDLTATLTVTASATGASDRTATATITAYGPMVPPTITRSGNTISIASSNVGATIHYTTDGTEPTSLSPTYTGPFNLTTSPTTIKAIVIRDGHSSQVATETFHMQLATPTITVSTNGNVTIEAETGASIRYTTDGTTPTASSPAYSGTFAASNPTIIKAIAVKTNYITSDVATAEYINSSVSGGKVVLDDREDHTWTYYTGVDASIDGGFYNSNYGNSTYHGKLYSPNPRNVKITYRGKNDVSGSNIVVKVSISEADSVFIYFKTLEEGTNSGEYPYQVISNPFSVRPSTGTGNSKVYYGFAGWKIMSGGEYIKGKSNGDVLALDENIVFENLPYPSVNCISAEIVFQTTWTQANVRSGSDISSMFGNFSGGTYETNIAVLTSTYTTAWTGDQNATVTSVYPDGSADSRSGVYTRLSNLTLSNEKTVKYEYIHINDNSSTFTMGTGTKTLYLGRGITNTTDGSSCCNLIQGCNGNITSGGLTYTLKIESGVYGNISYTRGLNTSQSASIAGSVNIKSVLGCDYDRAKKDNNKLKFTDEMWFGDGPTLTGTSSGQTVWSCIVKSGSMNSSLTSAGTGDGQNSFYIGIGANYSPGHRILEIEGGEFWSIAGGLDDNGETDPCVTIRIHNGTIKGAIYGSAANATAHGIKELILTGGEVRGWIGAGANGTANNGGKTYGKSYVYIGGKTNVVGNNNTAINGSVGGHVFGAGSGSASWTAGEMTEGSNVVVADEANIQGNVYGGGNYGFTDNYANVFVAGGTVNGSVFGGANQNKGDYTNIIMIGGLVKGGVYGGSNTSGTIGYNVTMQINGGQVGTSATDANIHGGGYGQLTVVTGDVDITLGTAGQTAPGVTVYGNVFGGSALGAVNGSSFSNSRHTNVTMNQGLINGNIFGGALGQASPLITAPVYGNITVSITGGKVVGNVYGGGDASAYGSSNIDYPQVNMSGGIVSKKSDNTLGNVFGGGKGATATVTGNPKVTLSGTAQVAGNVYGGGDAAAVSGKTQVVVQ